MSKHRKRALRLSRQYSEQGLPLQISSQHQLSAGKGKKLFLVLNRFESIDGSLSLNILSEDLLELELMELNWQPS